MASEAKKAFNVNIQRSGYFLDIHQQAHPSAGAPTLPYRELPRAAVVFAIGALDAYLSELAAEVMVQRLRKGIASSEARDVLQKIERKMPSLALEAALFQREEQRLGFVQQAIANYYHSSVSNHGPDSVGDVCKALNLSVSLVWSDSTVTSLGGPAELKRWTEVRHQIVHRGEKPRVRRDAHARPCVELVTAIVGAIEAEIARVSP